jgi:hypothetical protein
VTPRLCISLRISALILCNFNTIAPTRLFSPVFIVTKLELELDSRLSGFSGVCMKVRSKIQKLLEQTVNETAVVFGDSLHAFLR